MLQVPKATSYMGCIGDDAFGKKMTETATSEGVNVRSGQPVSSVGAAGSLSSMLRMLWLQVCYQVDTSTPTGSCAVCVTGIERSLVANLAAANNFKAEFAKAHWDLVEKVIGMCPCGRQLLATYPAQQQERHTAP
jgi:adenosine kinase